MAIVVTGLESGKANGTGEQVLFRRPMAVAPHMPEPVLDEWDNEDDEKFRRSSPDRQVITGSVTAKSHRRPGARRRVWTELDDLHMALWRSRKGGSAILGLIRTLRPEGKLSRITWGLKIRPDDLITQETIHDIARRYQQEKVGLRPEQDRAEWASSVGLTLYDNAGAATERYGAARRRYAIDAVTGLAATGMFDIGGERGARLVSHFMESLKAYDELLQAREEVRADIKGHKLRALGLGAVRFALGIPIMSVLRKPFQRLHMAVSCRGREVLRSIEAQRSRRFANVTVFVLAGLSIYAWRKAGNALPFIDDGNHHAAVVEPNALAPTHNQPSVPTPDIQQPITPVAPTDATPTMPDTGRGTGVPGESRGGRGIGMHFAQGAYETSAGEGWIHQFNDMGLRYDPDFMNNGAGAWLESQGYAYLNFDPSTGSYEWRMNHTNISPRALNELYRRAADAGLVK